MTVLILLTAVTILISICYFIHYYKFLRHLKDYPGPNFILMLVYSIFFDSLKDFLQASLDLHKKYGSAIKIQVGFLPPVVEITDPKLLENLLGSTKFLTKSIDYKYIQRWLGTGLLTSAPAKWRKHRKILTPAFHFQILDQFIETFNYYSEILVDKLGNEEGNNSINIYKYITLCSLDIICATSMGTAVNAQKDGTSEYVKSVKEMSRILMERVLSLLTASDFLYSLSPNFRAQERTLKVLHGYTNSVIASRKKELQDIGKARIDSDKHLGIKERNTFLDTLLKYKLDGGSITDEEIREEVDTFMFEGHDTTSSAISFTLYSLANHPIVQQKSIEEQRLIFGEDKDRCSTSKDLHSMKYLEMVIKESLRLYPPVALMGRQSEHDSEFNGKMLPKGVTLAVFSYGVHRDPDVYPEPERFDPERFTPENQAKRSPYAYIPFSAGPRNCIGQRFAMLEMKAVISKVLREFVLLPAIPEHKLVLVSELILKSRTGINIRLVKRKW